MDLSKWLSDGSEQETQAQEDDANGPRHINTEEFDRLISESALPVVVDFWAEWCGPCHMVSPAVSQLAHEFAGQAIVAKVNADQNPGVLTRYGIMGIPTIIYFVGGREADRIVGVTPYSNLKGKLEKLLSC